MRKVRDDFDVVGKEHTSDRIQLLVSVDCSTGVRFQYYLTTYHLDLIRKKIEPKIFHILIFLHYSN